MKKVLIFLLLLTTASSFGQSRSMRKMAEKMDELYLSYDFLSNDLVVSPEIFNPKKDTGIAYIEFFQDSSAAYTIPQWISASIDPGQSLNKNYVIGSIGLYRSYEMAVNVIVKRVFKDGRVEVETITIPFDQLILPDESYDSAAYGTEGVIESNDGQVVWS